jgi:hypothetical protein
MLALNPNGQLQRKTKEVALPSPIQPSSTHAFNLNWISSAERGWTIDRHESRT